MIQISSVKKDLEELKARKPQLMDAFLYRNVIDEIVFEEQHNKLTEDLTLTEMKLHDLKIQELDVEAVYRSPF